MKIERLTLVPPTEDRRPITLSESNIRSLNRPRQIVVIEIPTAAVAETTLARQAGVEAGYSIVITTTAGRTYSGYIEVAIEGTAGRFYWCGLTV
jgi:hypothetical protein